MPKPAYETDTSTAVALAESDHFSKLQILSLASGIGLEGVLALLDSDKLPALQQLSLKGTGIGDEDLAAIKSHLDAPGYGRIYICRPKTSLRFKLLFSLWPTCLKI